MLGQLLPHHKFTASAGICISIVLFSNSIFLRSDLMFFETMLVAMDAVNLLFKFLSAITFGRLCLTLLSYILLSFSYQIIYYRFFHPLSNFPGPFWASVTRLYSAYFNFVGRHYLHEWELHQKYGMSMDSMNTKPRCNE